MPFITLNGTLFEMQHDGAVENEPTYAGELTRSFTNKLRSGRRAKKRSWTFTLIPLSQTDYATLESTIGTDAPIPATGDFNAGVSVTVMVAISSAPYLPSGTSFVRTPIITLQEV